MFWNKPKPDLSFIEKIPLALNNLGIDKKQHTLLQNYIFNLCVTAGVEFRKFNKKEFEKWIKSL